MRKLLVAVLVLAVLGVAADFAAARVAEDRVAGIIQREYDLSRRPVVQVRDFPFLPHLATGRFRAVDVAAHDVRARGIAAREVELHLRDVRVDRGIVLGEGGRIAVGHAGGRVELGEAEIRRLLADRLDGGSLSIADDGVHLRVSTSLLGRQVAAAVVGRLSANGGRVTFTPRSVQLEGLPATGLESRLAAAFTFTIPLPDLPAGVRVERVVTGPGVVVLAGRAEAVRVTT